MDARFPTPWRVVDTDIGYKVTAADGREAYRILDQATFVDGWPSW